MLIELEDSFPESDRREREAEDVEKNRYSHQDWLRASEMTSSKLEQKLKEPRKLLLFRGAIYDITFNKDGEFSQSQFALLYDLPSEEDLANWRNIKVLVAPLGVKDIEFHVEDERGVYINKGFVERDIGVAPEKFVFSRIMFKLNVNNMGLSTESRVRFTPQWEILCQ